MSNFRTLAKEKIWKIKIKVFISEATGDWG